MKAKKTENGIVILLLLIGVSMIIGGIFYIKSVFKFKETAVQTTATVVDVKSQEDSEGNTYYKVYLTYNVDGKRYNDSYNTSAYVKENSKQTIYYDKNNPEKMETSISSGGGIIIIAFGFVFSLSGIFVFSKTRNNSQKNKNLMKCGEKIYAEFVAVVINNTYMINGRNPYNIICTGQDKVTGKIRTFKSENLWDNPEDIIKERNITTFPVYIDTKNNKKYYLSLEELKRSKKL